MAILIQRGLTVLAWARDAEEAREVADAYNNNGIAVTISESDDYHPPYTVPPPPTPKWHPYRVLVFPDGPWAASAPDIVTADDLAQILGPRFVDGVVIRYIPTGCTHWGHEVEHGPDCDGDQCDFDILSTGHIHAPDPNFDGEPYCWTYCVCPDSPHPPAAHGNVVYVQRCGCGATRLVEQNGHHWGVGPWTE